MNSFYMEQAKELLYNDYWRTSPNNYEAEGYTELISSEKGVSSSSIKEMMSNLFGEDVFYKNIYDTKHEDDLEAYSPYNTQILLNGNTCKFVSKLLYRTVSEKLAYCVWNKGNYLDDYLIPSFPVVVVFQIVISNDNLKISDGDNIEIRYCSEDGNYSSKFIKDLQIISNEQCLSSENILIETIVCAAKEVTEVQTIDKKTTAIEDIKLIADDLIASYALKGRMFDKETYELINAILNLK